MKSVKSVAAVAVMKVKAGLDVGWMGPLGGSNLFHGLQLQTRVTNLESCSPSKDQEMTIRIPICDSSRARLFINMDNVHWIELD